MSALSAQLAASIAPTPAGASVQNQPYLFATIAAPATATGPFALAASRAVTPASSYVTQEPSTTDATPLRYTHSRPAVSRATEPTGFWAESCTSPVWPMAGAV